MSNSDNKLRGKLGLNNVTLTLIKGKKPYYFVEFDWGGTTVIDVNHKQLRLEK